MDEQNVQNIPLMPAEPVAKKHGFMPVIGIAIVVILVAFGAIFFMNQKNSKDNGVVENTIQEGTQSPVVSSATQESKLIETEKNVVTVEMEAGSFYFTPNVISVKKGDVVKVVLKAVDMQHNFVIEELDVESDIIKAGDTTTITFAADEVGEFEFFCDVASHRTQGQVGTLKVTAQ